MGDLKPTYYSYSNRGGQPNNEDAIFIKATDNAGTFVLCDGLGGHRNGEIASKMVSEALLSKLQSGQKPSGEALHRAFQEANAELLKKQTNPTYGVMKTTAVLLDIRDGQALWGHVGDSRLYYFSGNERKARTADHSVSYKKYLAGEITAQQINSDEDRSSLLNVLGNPSYCRPEVLPQPQVLRPWDAFLLCSDGFWEYVFDEEMLIDFLKAKKPMQWAELMLLRHIARAQPENDNFSLITVFATRNTAAPRRSSNENGY